MDEVTDFGVHFDANLGSHLGEVTDFGLHFDVILGSFWVGRPIRSS